jgi:hypothetical protein
MCIIDNEGKLTIGIAKFEMYCHFYNDNLTLIVAFDNNITFQNDTNDPEAIQPGLTISKGATLNSSPGVQYVNILISNDELIFQNENDANGQSYITIGFQSGVDISQFEKSLMLVTSFTPYKEPSQEPK